MASSHSYLSAAAKCKQRHESQSKGVEISSNEIVCEDNTSHTTPTNVNTSSTHITHPDETMAGQVTEVTLGGIIATQVRCDVERTFSPLLSPLLLSKQDKGNILKIGPP